MPSHKKLKQNAKCEISTSSTGTGTYQICFTKLLQKIMFPQNWSKHNSHLARTTFQLKKLIWQLPNFEKQESQKMTHPTVHRISSRWEK